MDKENAVCEHTHTHTVDYYSARKRNRGSNTDGSRGYCVSQSEKHIHRMMSPICGV